jgi:hypothetical protein
MYSIIKERGIYTVTIHLVPSSRATTSAEEFNKPRKQEQEKVLQFIMSRPSHRSRSPSILLQINSLLTPPLIPRVPKVLFHILVHLVWQHNRILDMQVSKLWSLFVTPDWHALVCEHFDSIWLNDLTALARELNSVAVQMCEVASPVAQPCFPQTQHFAPEQIIALATEESAICTIVFFFSCAQYRIFLDNLYDEVSSNVIRTLVCFVFVIDPRAFGHAFFNVDGEGLDFSDVTGSTAGLAFVLDGCAFAAAVIALHLHLLEDSRSELCLLDNHTVTLALVASFGFAILRTRALAFGTDGLFFQLNLVFGAVVEIAEGYCDSHFHVGTSALAGLAKVTTTAKEAREEIEGVASMTVTSFLVLFEAFVAVLIVNFACLGLGKGFVGFGDFDEFLLGCLVTTVLCVLVG